MFADDNEVGIDFLGGSQDYRHLWIDLVLFAADSPG